MRRDAWLLLPMLALALAACAPPPPASSGVAAEPTTTPAAGATLRPRPTPTPPPTISRLVLATKIDGDEAPLDDLTTVPAGVERIYLAVRTHNLTSGTTLRAVWLHGDAEIARVERVVTEGRPGERWLALAFAPDAPLAAGEYAVRLEIDGVAPQSLVFRVDGASDGPARAGLFFSSAFEHDGQVIQAIDVFPAGTSRVVAIWIDALATRGDDLFSRWYVDDRLYAELGPDPTVAAAVTSFSLSGPAPLPPGRYRVEILLDGTVRASGQFEILSPATPEPTPTPTPTPTPAPTPAPAAGPLVESFVLAAGIDPASGAPAEPLQVVTAPATIYAAAQVRGLTAADQLIARVERQGAPVAEVAFEPGAVEYGWISVALEVEWEPGLYRVLLLLGGEVVAARELEARS